jgi:uncharacterized NAD(P)/FAD-binding protein YdhS
MAPSVAAAVEESTRAGVFGTAAARVLRAQGALDGVCLTVRRRGESAVETLHFDWVVNCTGPASGRGVGLPALILDLLKEGHLEEDSRGLGVRSTCAGYAVAQDRVSEDLLVVGSLRKADLWECTAVPELRLQAAGAAEALVNHPTLLAAGAACASAGIGGAYVNHT